jgi:cytochrome b subunit of formate dehydrogenase
MKLTINSVVDLLMLIVLIPNLISGIVLYAILPESGRFSGLALYLGITRNGWKDLHNYAGFALAALIILHLVLHWRYFRALPSRFRTGEKKESGD